MTGPPSLMSGNTVRKVTKISSTARMWIRSWLFLRWNNVWDSLSTSATKCGSGPSSLESIPSRALLTRCDGGLFQDRGGPSLGRILSLIGSCPFSPSPGMPWGWSRSRQWAIKHACTQSRLRVCPLLRISPSIPQGCNHNYQYTISIEMPM